MSFIRTDSCETGITRGEELAQGLGKSPFRDFLGSEQGFGILKVLNGWTYMWNKMMKKKKAEVKSFKSTSELPRDMALKPHCQITMSELRVNFQIASWPVGKYLN